MAFSCDYFKKLAYYKIFSYLGGRGLEERGEAIWLVAERALGISLHNIYYQNK